MALGASSYRKFFFINRNNAITLELNLCANDKVELTRDMEKATLRYKEALNTKTLKWSNNAGVSYVDLSYDNLMRPSSMNLNDPIMITDLSGAVVIDSRYEQYAQMISPDGSPNGDWESNRSQILSDITGIDKDVIENSSNYDVDVYNAQNAVNDAKAGKNSVSKKGCTGKTATQMMQSLGKTSNMDWKAEASKSPSKIEIGSDPSSASSKISKILDDLRPLAPHFGKYAEEFTDAIDQVKNRYNSGYLKDNITDDSGKEACYKKDGKYYVNASALLEAVLSCLPEEAEYPSENGYQNSKRYEYWEKTEDYEKYKKELEGAETNVKSAEGDYNSKVSSKSQLLTAEQQRLIEFYDKLFSTIADKGWVKNDSITDTDYLNEMFQNNLYTLTTVNRNSNAVTDPTSKSCTGFSWSNDYETDIASNNTNIFTVNDTDIQNEAMVQYEAEKATIQRKENKIDIRMDNLKTEQAAIKLMMEGADKVANDNIERTFSANG